jgi:hypothetical protein
MKNYFKNLVSFFLIFLVIAAIFSAFGFNSNTKTVGLDVLVSRINNEEVDSVSVEGDKISLALKDGNKEIVKKEIKTL